MNSFFKSVFTKEDDQIELFLNEASHSLFEEEASPPFMPCGNRNKIEVDDIHISENTIETKF